MCLQRTESKLVILCLQRTESKLLVLCLQRTESKLLVTGPASIGNVLCTVGLSILSCSCLILVDSFSVSAVRSVAASCHLAGCLILVDSFSVSAVRSVAASCHLAVEGAQEDATGDVFFSLFIFFVSLCCHT